MKKLLTLLLITISGFAFITGCQKSNENKAKELIKKHLSTTMNDFKSYEPVEFSKLDSAMTEFDEEDFLNTDTLAIFSQSEIELLLKKNRDNFKPKFEGYKMSHRFRGKNALGALVINESNYYFDPEISKIIKSVDRIVLQ